MQALLRGRALVTFQCPAVRARSVNGFQVTIVTTDAIGDFHVNRWWVRAVYPARWGVVGIVILDLDLPSYYS
jgi:hypothetical protein